MTLLECLGRDPRFADLGGRKAAALEIIIRAADAILSGDCSWPMWWERIEDAARVEQGKTAMQIWQEDV